MGLEKLSRYIASDWKKSPAGIFLLAIFIISYSTYYSFTLINHELWRDEIQHWGIAAFSDDLSELSSNLKYESRPPFWLSILFVMSRLTTNPEHIRIIALILFLITTALVLSLRKFPLFVRIATLLGFYFLYGYSVNAREYNLLLVLHLLMMKETEKSKIRLWYFGILLLGLGLTNGYGFILCIYWIVVEVAKVWKNDNRLKTFISIAPLLAIISFAQYYYKAPKDSIFATNLENFSAYSIKQSLKNVLIYPFLPFYKHQIPNLLLVLIAIAIVCFLIASLKTIPYTFRIAFLIAMLAVFVNSVIGYYQYWWHFGIVFMLFYSSSYGAAQNRNGWIKHKGILVFFLTLQISGSALGVGKDFDSEKTYSNISKASNYIERNCDDCTVVTFSSVFGAPLASYIRPIKVYSVDVQRFVYFTTWESKNFERISNSDINMALSKFKEVLIVTSQQQQLDKSKYKLLASFDDAIWNDNYQIYRLITR